MQREPCEVTRWPGGSDGPQWCEGWKFVSGLNQCRQSGVQEEQLAYFQTFLGKTFVKPLFNLTSCFTQVHVCTLFPCSMPDHLFT